MEDENKELTEVAKENPLDRLKGFVCKHGKEIAIGAGVCVIGVGTVVFFKKNPEVGERLLISFTGLFDSDEEPEILEITDVADLTDSELDHLIEETTEAIPESIDADLSETFSARRIGNMTGETDRKINALLKENGFMEGSPGFYKPTSKGEPFCVERADDNGYGGYAARGWGWLEWSKDIIPLLGLKYPEEHLKEVNRNRALAGLEPLKDLT